jgi:hypothetical protein
MWPPRRFCRPSCAFREVPDLTSAAHIKLNNGLKLASRVEQLCSRTPDNFYPADPARQSGDHTPSGGLAFKDAGRPPLCKQTEAKSPKRGALEQSPRGRMSGIFGTCSSLAGQSRGSSSAAKSGDGTMDDAGSTNASSNSIPTPRARWNWDESPSRSRFLIEHDLFGKPLHTFPDHALQ